MGEIRNSVIKTAHEESYSDGRVIGVIMNHNSKSERIDSFIYLFVKRVQHIFSSNLSWI